jgi:hypothetical protein
MALEVNDFLSFTLPLVGNSHSLHGTIAFGRVWLLSNEYFFV